MAQLRHRVAPVPGRGQELPVRVQGQGSLEHRVVSAEARGGFFVTGERLVWVAASCGQPGC